MALRKCPKCELNYLREGQTLCDVCMRQKKHHSAAAATENEVIMCSECGEKPAVEGSDLCEDCLREQKRQRERDLEDVTLMEDPSDSYDEKEEPEEE